MKTYATKFRSLLALAGSLAALDLHQRPRRRRRPRHPARIDDEALSHGPSRHIGLDELGAPLQAQADYDTFYDHDGEPATPQIRRCNFVCPTGDCATPRDGDDPASKFRQAKEAIYEVMRNVDDIDLGFATYNNDDGVVQGKHWLYQVKAGEPANRSGVGPHALLTARRRSSGPWSVATAATETTTRWDVSPPATEPPTPMTYWELTKVRRLPKFGVNPATTVSNVTYYIRDGGRVYFVTYSGATQTYDGELLVHVRVDRCTGSPH